jgi:pentatricopeptide repeat protein
MLHNLCRAGHFKQAQEIFSQMIQKEVSPDIITFNTLIYWLGKSSRAIEALDLFRDMRTRGVEPDSLTFRYLVSGLLEEGKVTLAYEVWEYMMENGIILDRDVSDRLINVLKSKNK